ncbi:hypothetical protein ABZS79_02645 [Streptomyces griseoloalbus]|uniref:hypothetical protein n=1 Tax=Streptomyces griseoloalbus TaxID=67303 RepID=UPI0033B800E3
MRIPPGHVHGAWPASCVQGPHTHVVPVTRDRGPGGPARARHRAADLPGVALVPVTRFDHLMGAADAAPLDVFGIRTEGLTDTVRGFVAGPPRARPAGGGARAAAPARHGLSRFPDDGERLLKEVAR